MPEAGRSRRLEARVAWRATLGDEESRALLQDRLAVLSSRSFWSFVIFLGYIELMYALFPEVRPARDVTILLGSAGGLLVLLVTWRGFLVRRPLSIPTLNLIDALYASGTGVCFAFGAYLAVDFKPAPYTCLLFTSLMVLSRSIILPSSARRTLVMSIIAFLPFAVAGVALSIQGWEDLPTFAIVSSVFLIFSVVTLLAVTGSRTVYELRQRSSAAMQLGQYTLVRKLNEGGMGVIWLADHVLLRRPTAIKLLQPDRIGADTVDRFEHEVRHMSQLSHPNTVAIYDYGRSANGVFYYAMEYLDGIELDALVAEDGPLPYGRAVAVLVQVCGALEEAHRSGVIHRDIKPANIILCERGGQPDVAKVVDYGLVKRIESMDADLSAEPAAKLTLDKEAILGTPGYLAPEAITHKTLGPATDLYSVGALSYFLLTGKPVFEGKTAMAVCIAHITNTPTPMSEVTTNPIPPELERIVMQCLAKDPADRPASAGALARLLAAVPASDWNIDQASAWWKTFRLQPRHAIPTATPATMDIDLARRASPGA